MVNSRKYKKKVYYEYIKFVYYASCNIGILVLCLVKRSVRDYKTIKNLSNDLPTCFKISRLKETITDNYCLDMSHGFLSISTTYMV